MQHSQKGSNSKLGERRLKRKEESGSRGNPGLGDLQVKKLQKDNKNELEIWQRM